MVGPTLYWVEVITLANMFVHVYEEMSDKNLQQAVKEIQFLRSNGDEMASLGLKKHILQGTGRGGGGVTWTHIIILSVILVVGRAVTMIVVHPSDVMFPSCPLPIMQYLVLTARTNLAKHTDTNIDERWCTHLTWNNYTYTVHLNTDKPVGHLL